MNKKTSPFNEVNEADALKRIISDLLKENDFTSKDYVSIIPIQKKRRITINCRTIKARDRIYNTLIVFAFLEKTGKKTLAVTGIRPTEEIDDLYNGVLKLHQEVILLLKIVNQQIKYHLGKKIIKN